MNSGDTFAHYEIIGPIGRGAMGEVFSARDTRLGREVAVKVLPADFATDPDRLARFRREAKVLAALNHTNIAAIHGLEEDQDKLYLAMELAPGETLEARIDRGAMPTADALAVAIQIAAGLEEAHAKSIVHRDLKPANVKLSDDGRIKILDFGLARAYQGEEEAAADPGTSPTMTAAMTQAGVILGTAAYMSPEQARGLEVDDRTDIWAFGVILWELLAGRRLFAGETITDTLAMVLRSDPEWNALPTDLPPSLRRLLQRCLQRDKRQRMHHIADARIVLEEILQDGTSAYEPAAGSIAPMSSSALARNRTGWLVAGVLALAVAALGWQYFQAPALTDPAPVRFDVEMPSDQWITSERQPLGVTPSGDAFVVSLKTSTGTQFYFRSLSDPEIIPIAGTENADNPFFSPDGKWLGFTQNRTMKKMALDGGSPIDLCEAQWGGGTWTTDDRIIFTGSYSSGLYVVPAAGGEPQQLTTPDAEHDELGHWWPQVLPGDEWVIYTGFSTPIENARIMALSLASGEQRVLIEGGAYGSWTPTGHLVFVRDGKLFAAPFDAKSIAVTGAAVPVLEDVHYRSNDGLSALSFGANGTLVYAPASVMDAPSRLAWVDRQGNLEPLDLPERRYHRPRLSPDGKLLAVAVETDNNQDIWIHEFERGTFSRFTFAPSSDFNPLWTPDNRTVIYNGEDPQFTIYQRPADGSSDTQLLLNKPIDTTPTSISPDGKWLVYSASSMANSSDIWMLPMDGDGTPRLFLQTPFGEGAAAISPDGHWLAYYSNESGNSEVYATPFPGGGSRVQISIGGGSDPQWSPLGDELYFNQRSVMMVAAIDTENSSATSLVAGRPQPMFSSEKSIFVPAGGRFSPTPDAQKFLIAHTPDESQPRSVRVVVNWFTELRQN
ncbi:MAG: protein kinase [Candidatus Krumholzibacteria bacterium]|nr:protein kinase [Candidatus Krumholzibacteria bacterium]